MSQHSDPEIQRLQSEVDKLGRVMSEVMGAEFDSIMARQTENQRASIRWMATSMAMMLSTIRLLIDRGVLDKDEVITRVREVRDRLITHAEAIGTDADVAEMFGDVLAEEPPGP